MTIKTTQPPSETPIVAFARVPYGLLAKAALAYMSTRPMGATSQDIRPAVLAARLAYCKERNIVEPQRTQSQDCIASLMARLVSSGALVKVCRVRVGKTPMHVLTLPEHADEARAAAQAREKAEAEQAARQAAEAMAAAHAKAEEKEYAWTYCPPGKATPPRFVPVSTGWRPPAMACARAEVPKEEKDLIPSLVGGVRVPHRPGHYVAALSSSTNA